MIPTCRLLAIDGGGIRGILPARILMEIERRTGRRIADTFNLIAGTSTGGLLALGLATPRPNQETPYSAEQLLDFYQSKGPKIFAKSLWQSFTSLGAITDERYDSHNVDEVLKELLEDRWLSDCLDEVDVLIPAYEIESRTAYFFKSWHAKGSPIDDLHRPEQRDFLARDVARSTSAAPTYFQPSHVRNRAGQTFSFLDGGLFANNPTVAAIVAAHWLYPDAERYCVLSLGTGELKRRIPYDDAKDWGLLGWARPIISVMMDGNSATVHYQMREIAAAFEVDMNYQRFEIDLKRRDDNALPVNDDFDDASKGNLQALFAKADDFLAMHREPLDALIDGFIAEAKTPRATLRGPTTA